MEYIEDVLKVEETDKRIRMKFEFKSPSKERMKAVYNHLVLGMGESAVQ